MSLILIQADTMTPETQAQIEDLIKTNKVMLFMKGTKLMPMCGFSNTVVQILNAAGVPFETFNVLDNPEIREGIKEFSNWPTIPQLYINGEFVGGSDIAIELFQSGELQQMLEVALAS
jgi:monothiol glutaredoxin